MPRFQFMPARISPTPSAPAPPHPPLPPLQDRCTLIPSVLGRDDLAFLGVFDGTVGDTAADFVHMHLADSICGHKVSSGPPTECANWGAYCASASSGRRGA